MLSYINNFLRLFFPKYCEACSSSLLSNESVLCTKCLYEIPKTKFHKKEDNVVNRLFYGISNVKYSTAYFYFKQGSKFRKLIHKLKYNNQTDLGIELGRMFGNEIKESVFEAVDILLPVPLHPAKKRKRGYNQSELIAKGISEILEKDLRTDLLKRSRYTETQTKKNLEERRENVNSAFKVSNPDQLKNKHVLVIDDVLTTGSTLASCANELLKIDGITVSTAVLAYADQ